MWWCELSVAGAGDERWIPMSEMSGDQSRLTFTTTDWSTAQTVIVAAAHDDDGDAGSATITHAVVDAESDEDYDPVPDVALNCGCVRMMMLPAIVVTAAENFTVVEGSTATYTVELVTKPGGDVVVQLSVAGSGVTVDTDGVMTGDQDRLTFTSVGLEQRRRP